MKNAIYALALATTFNVIGSGIVLLDLAVWGPNAQVAAGLTGLVCTAFSAGLMVLGGRTPPA